MSDLSILENKLQHKFSNIEFLEEALTHPSSGSYLGAPDYERLEFLGDRVLGLVVADWLFCEFPKDAEGVLARRHSNLVCKTALAEVAKNVGIDKFIKLARGERKTGGDKKASVLSNCCEAIIAALYKDGGLKASENFIKLYWKDFIKINISAKKDNKSSLQEWAQGRGFDSPTYSVLEQSGPQHAPLFIIKVSIDTVGSSEAKGTNKQEAAQKAAGYLLKIVKEKESGEKND